MNFWKVIGGSEFVFEMLVFSFVLGRHFVRRKYFGLRAAVGCTICFWGSILMFMYTKTMWESIPGIILAYLLVFLTFLFCFENPVEDIFFVNTAAYILQAVLYSMFIVSDTLLGQHGKAVTGGLYTVLLTGTVIVLEYSMGRKLRKASGVIVNSAWILFLLLTAGLIDTVFKYYMVEHQLGKDSGGVFVAWKLFSMGSCILLLLVQFSLLQKNFLSAEKQKLEELFYQKQQQYEIFKKNMELINIKCHDLKHWLQTMDGHIVREGAEEIQKALSIYDSMVSTGNETLDVILTEKKLFCEYNRIALFCIAEGERLDFLTKGEICSLFGNIVDNAVEAVLKVEDEEKRTISLLIRSKGDFLSIHEENYYEGELKRSSAGFETTKEDKNHHGFGLKSIRMIAENHHGNVSIHVNDGIFNINILFPLKIKKISAEET